MIKSNSNMDTFGYIYNNTFNPSTPSENLMATDDDGGNERQFLFRIFIDFTSKYILLITAFSPNTLGTFTVLASGIGSAVFMRT